ncbi:MAG: plasmid pRiA4b ORF-3 family protein [Blastocatellia bacterium]|nr:plasmid pRiA4b ORF-3 family protein [Blastocatellia bacterium]
MARRKQPKGTCLYCGQEMAKGGMSKHLSACPKRQAAIEKAGSKKIGNETLYHLRVEPVWPSDFWLDLEVRGSSTLEVLDHYLRAIWLECCGHMSQFSVGGWRGKEISMKRSIEAVFKPGVELTHIYDFGTSSETLIKVAGTREGKPTTARSIALMARNLMPEAVCIECEQPATHLCQECIAEEDVSGTLCKKHAKTHPHDDYGDPMPLVNSPRLGMCGYEGPADPPY